MSEEKKLELLAEAFECEVEDLDASKQLDDMEEWNSMTMLSLIVLMDDEFGKTLTRDDMANFSTIGDILQFMG